MHSNATLFPPKNEKKQLIDGLIDKLKSYDLTGKYKIAYEEAQGIDVSETFYAPSDYLLCLIPQELIPVIVAKLKLLEPNYIKPSCYLKILRPNMPYAAIKIPDDADPFANLSKEKLEEAIADITKIFDAFFKNLENLEAGEAAEALEAKNLNKEKPSMLPAFCSKFVR